MPPKIILNQSGKAAGEAGIAREDFDLATPVLISLEGGPFAQVFWTLLDKPVDWPGDAIATDVIADPNAASTQVQALTVNGTRLLQAVVDSGLGLGARAEDTTRITFFAGAAPPNPVPTAFPRRIPAFGEKREHNVKSALFPAGNPLGWKEAIDKWLLTLQAAAGSGSDIVAWGLVQLTGGVATLTTPSRGIVSVAATVTGTVEVTLAVNQDVTVVASAEGAVGGEAMMTGRAGAVITIERSDSDGNLIDSHFTIAVFSHA